MSIPFFFHPYRVGNIPRGAKAMGRWKKFADYELTLLKSCVFVDGGIMSNFPITLSPPRSGTVGTDVRRQTRRRPAQDGGNRETVRSFTSDLRFGAFQPRRGFHRALPDYRKLVSCIGTGHYHWLNFDLSEADKLDLFKRGAAEADRFLRGFDWAEYKEIRRGIARTIKDAHLPKEIMAGDGVASASKSV